MHLVAHTLIIEGLGLQRLFPRFYLHHQCLSSLLPPLHVMLLYRASGNKFSHLSFGDFSNTVLMRTARNDAPSTPAPLSVPSRLSTRSARRRLSQQQSPSGPAAWRTHVNNLTDVDWVSAGVVTPIRDQGLLCGKCNNVMEPCELGSGYLRSYTV